MLVQSQKKQAMLFVGPHTGVSVRIGVDHCGRTTLSTGQINGLGLRLGLRMAPEVLTSTPSDLLRCASTDDRCYLLIVSPVLVQSQKK